ncbi:unnamed protein product, partial [Polarella glacialis]
LVLPTVGRRSVAACCSGGDVDGDLFSVIWASDLVPPSQLMQPSLDYDALLAEAGEPVGAKSTTDGNFTEQDLVHFFCRVVANDTLGKIAHLHLAFCDSSPMGALDPLAIELAKAQSLAVDFPKTGIPPQVPQDAVRAVKENDYPDFMQKAQQESYTSEKALGVLFRRCVSLDADFEAAAPFDVDSELLIPGREAWAGDAAKACTAFRHDLLQLLLAHGLRHETEALLATALRWPPTASNRGRASKMIRSHFDLLVQKHRGWFFEGLKASDRRPKASAWYEVAYRPTEQRGFRACRTFAWLVGEILCEIKAQAVSGKSRLQLAEVHAIIGRSAVAELLESLPTLQQTVASRLAVMPVVQRALDSHCAGLQGQSASEEERPFSVHPFGSTVLGLCEPESDLDLCIVLAPCAFRPPFVAAAQVGDFSRLDATAQARHFLQIVVSPAVDAVARAKKEVLSARVPLVRLTMAGVLESAEEVSVDITLSQEGWLKAGHFRSSFLEASPAVFGSVILLTKWARTVGLVRSMSDQPPGSQATGPGSRAPEVVSAMVPGEWQALLLHLASHDDALGTLLSAAKPSSAGHVASEPGGLLRDLSDYCMATNNTNNTNNNNKNNNSNVSQMSLTTVGSLLLEFFRAMAGLSGSVAYTWPVQGAPIHELSSEVCAMVAVHASRAVEVLSVARSFPAACASGAAASETSICRRLSRALSFKLYSHRQFHEAHFRAVSGAVVKLEPMDGSELLLLHGSGSCAQILELQRELQKYVNASRAVGMPSTRASRYFMEGSTRLFFAAASSLESRLQFRPSFGAHVPIHAACERTVPHLNLPECGAAWESEALERFL